MKPSDKIWLEPECDECDERCWSCAPFDDCEECGKEATGYVRDDIVLASTAEASRMFDRIKKLEAALQEPTLPMLLAGKKSLYSCSEDPEIEDARACFLAMARKALEGKDD